MKSQSMWFQTLRLLMKWRQAPQFSRFDLFYAIEPQCAFYGWPSIETLI
jgi:hypothetical protein